MKVLASLALGAWLLALSLIVVAKPAYAGGSVRAENNGVMQEQDGTWTLKLTIDYGATPEIQFIPVDFTFVQTMLYERALTDEGGDKPIVTKKALQNQAPRTEGMDVKFSDGLGKVDRKTGFKVVLKRKDGFEAGEYELTLKKSDGGQQIGQKLKLVLNGDNPVVNRKSMNFGADTGRDDPSKVKSKALTDPPPAKDGEGSDSGSSGSSGADTTPASDDSKPGEVKPKQGGCGCETVGASDRTLAWPLGLVTVAAVALRASRRRQRA